MARSASVSGAAPPAGLPCRALPVSARTGARRSVIAAAEGGGGDATPKTRLMPIFPLGTCALPGVSLPLNIFEARYR